MRASFVRVSVVMPVYNTARYLEEAIESVLSQRHDSFELLVCDDGSRDATPSILRRYRRHEKIRLFSNRKNVGAAATRNRLIRKANGRYITPCDSDDLMLPDNLHRLSRVLDASREIGLVYADSVMVRIDSKDRMVGSASVRGKDHSRVWDLVEESVNHGGAMIRKSKIIEVGGYDEEFYSLDDLSLMLKLAEVTKFKYLQGEVYYLWRRHPASMTMTERNRRRDLLKAIARAAQRRSSPRRTDAE